MSVSSSFKEELQRLEDSLDWFNIMVYRKAAAKVRVHSHTVPFLS